MRARTNKHKERGFIFSVMTALEAESIINKGGL